MAGTETLASATTPNEHADLDEFRLDALRVSAIAVAVLGTAYDLWLAARPEQMPDIPVPLDLGFLGVAAATLFLMRTGPVWASLALNSGLTLVMTGALWLHPDQPVVCLLALVPMLVAILHGWRIGFAAAGLMSGLILGLTAAIPAPASQQAAGIALVMVWLNTALAWMATRPVSAALDSAWSSYLQAQRSTQEARRRQAELAQANRSLDEACYRLEQANSELERARRAAVRAREMRDRFVATVSHEMRTPLNLIIGFSELLMEPGRFDCDSWSDEKSNRAGLHAFREDVEAIYRNACHLSNLIDDVLDLARIEADKLPLERDWHALAQIAEEAVLTAGALAREKGLSLEVEVPADLPPVWVDRTRVRQVLINLLSNASRFTSRGSIRVRAEPDRDGVVVRVEDTGAGIPQRYLDEVFEEFSQVRSAPRSRSGGTGLGLTICKRIIELHGGRLWAESRLGQGSVFSFSLPTVDAEGAASSTAWKSRIKPALQPEAPKRVAALADEPSLYRMLQRHLEGYDLLTLGDASQSREAAEPRPQAILAVARDGDWLQRQLGLARQASQVPIIACQLQGRDGLGLEMGVRAYLTKPVTRDQLAGALQRLPRGIRSCLIVDDDPQLVRLLSYMVRSLRRSWEVRSCAGGAEAIAELSRWRPGVILLDLLMPEVDGYAVLSHLRQAHGLEDIPVVIVSAYSQEGDRVAATRVQIECQDGIEGTELRRCLRASLDAVTAAGYESDRASSAGS